MQRNQKICKMIEEFSLFILENHSNNINIDIKEIENKTVVRFTTDLMNNNLIDFVKTNIKPERLVEVEEYGWELMGEGSSDDDLPLVGNLIDKMEIENVDNKTIITMFRYEKY